jgi:hypothetical protein
MSSVALEREMAGELLTKVSAVLTYLSVGTYVSAVRDQFRVGRVVLYRLTILVGRLLVPSLLLFDVKLCSGMTRLVAYTIPSVGVLKYCLVFDVQFLFRHP